MAVRRMDEHDLIPYQITLLLFLPYSCRKITKRIAKTQEWKRGRRSSEEGEEKTRKASINELQARKKVLLQKLTITTERKKWI